MTTIKDIQAISRQSRRAVLRIMIQSEVQGRRDMVAYVSRRDFWARLLSWASLLTAMRTQVLYALILAAALAFISCRFLVVGTKDLSGTNVILRLNE